MFQLQEITAFLLVSLKQEETEVHLKNKTTEKKSDDENIWDLVQ